MTSMLEYLASLRKHGHRPVHIGEVVIGKTHYAAGDFVSPERDAPAGSRAAREGRKIPSEHRIALMPMYRSDWVTHNSTGPTPKLLPASYLRSSNVVYILDGEEWYINGWNDKDGVLWLNRVGDYNIDLERKHHRQQASVHWTESFETAMALAGPEVRARIAVISA